MVSQWQDIQQPLQAEEVPEARKRKNRTQKQAKEAAQADVEQSRLRREKELRAKEAAARGAQGSCRVAVEKETPEMTVLQTYFKQNRDKVLDNLLVFIRDIQPQIHKTIASLAKGKESHTCAQGPALHPFRGHGGSVGLA
ncbi:V-type proton ATPase subunit G 1-like [Sorex araneus]|uniref:V-type proton ATPase subunit G 1-like n=1 Tax=Sorex araneus TaxID=42254 RepID=UPI002433866F|nr:V-type proton ATPase subunit G 1-like [Sorex araneus]